MEDLIGKSFDELDEMLDDARIKISGLQTEMTLIIAAKSEKQRLIDLQNKLSGITLDDIEKIKAQMLSAGPIGSEESVKLN